MNENEIIKALECCASKQIGNCRKLKCPMRSECRRDIKSAEKHALDLINRQKAEIERLEKLAKNRADVNFDKIAQVVCRAREDIEATAIKRFAERLCADRVSNDPVVIAVKCELKEMVGDDK